MASPAHCKYSQRPRHNLSSLRSFDVHGSAPQWWQHLQLLGPQRFLEWVKEGKGKKNFYPQEEDQICQRFMYNNNNKRKGVGQTNNVF